MMSLEETCKFREATLEDRENIVEFVNEHFVPFEPINKAIGLCEEGYRMPYFDKWVEDSLVSPDVIAILAEDKESGELLGIVINVIHVMDYEKEVKAIEEEEVLSRCRKPPAKFLSVLRFLEHLGHDIDVAAQYGVDKWSDLMLVAGRVDRRVPGLGTELIKRSLNRAEEQGIKVQLGCATSYFTGRIFEKLGFSLVKSIKYEDYKMDGVVVFPPEEPHLEGKFFVKLF